MTTILGTIFADENQRLVAADAIDACLREHVLAKWFPAAIDRARGGFHQNFAADWTRIAGRDERSVVYQARLTWLAAQASLHLPGQAETFRGYARHGFEFLDTKLWDTERGGLFWGLDGDGTPERGGEKHAYGIAFAIYAAATDHHARGDSRSLDLAKRAFAWLDTHAHDPKNGGYFEALTRSGEPILAPPNGQSTNDFIGTRYGYKSMNTHIHLLEAFAALFETWPDATVRARLVEVFEIVRDRIVVAPPGVMNLFFTPDWRAVPDHDSFGHDVETAFLLAEAAAVLKQPDDPETWRAARALVDHALEFGWDEAHGGFYDAGTTFGGSPIVSEKIWWVEAEGLNALLLLHERFGTETPRYGDAFRAQWEFIRKFQIDSKHGGWLANVRADGTPIAGQNKSDRWTEGYHQGRALMTVARTLRGRKPSNHPR